MKIKLQLAGTIGRLAAPELEMNLKAGASISDMIDALVKQYGAEFAGRINYREMWQVSINGNVHLLTAAAETQLHDRDEVTILPLHFGG